MVLDAADEKIPLPLPSDIHHLKQKPPTKRSRKVEGSLFKHFII